MDSLRKSCAITSTSIRTFARKCSWKLQRKGVLDTDNIWKFSCTGQITFAMQVATLRGRETYKLERIYENEIPDWRIKYIFYSIAFLSTNFSYIHILIPWGKRKNIYFQDARATKWTRARIYVCSFKIIVGIWKWKPRCSEMNLLHRRKITECGN